MHACWSSVLERGLVQTRRATRDISGCFLGLQCTIAIFLLHTSQIWRFGSNHFVQRNWIPFLVYRSVGRHANKNVIELVEQLLSQVTLHSTCTFFFDRVRRWNRNPCSANRIDFQRVAGWRSVGSWRSYIVDTKFGIQSHYFIPHCIWSCRGERLRCSRITRLTKCINWQEWWKWATVLKRIRSLLHISEMPTPASESNQ